MLTSLEIRVKADDTATPDHIGHLPPTGKVRVGISPDHDGSVPAEHQFGMQTLRKGRHQGWLDIDGFERVVLEVAQPDGKNPALFSVIRAKGLTLHTIDGDVRFTATRQPGLYVDGTQVDDEIPLTEDGSTPDGLEVFLGLDTEMTKDSRSWEGKA